MAILSTRLLWSQIAAPVEIYKVEKVPIEQKTPFLAIVESLRSGVIASSIEGMVTHYEVKIGDHVKKGQVIARLRDSVLKLQLKSGEAQIKEITERHLQALRHLERTKKLFKQEAVPQKELDDAQSAATILESQLIQAKTQVQIIQADIEKKIIKAPFDGQIVEELTQIGEWLTLGGQAARIVDLSSVYMRINLPERYVRFLKVGESVSIKVPSLPKNKYEGKVASIVESGDRSARTFPVRVLVKNDGKLKAAMSARVALPVGEAKKSLVVHKDALLQKGKEISVYVAEKGIVRFQKIEIGDSHGETVEVLNGLKEGDEVVVKGNERLRPGQAVRIVSSTK